MGLPRPRRTTRSWRGKVIEVVKGGVIVLYKAMRIFVPASQATASRGEDLNELMGQEVRFRIIEVNRQRRRAVGSIRSVLREERKAAQEKFWGAGGRGPALHRQGEVPHQLWRLCGFGRRGRHGPHLRALLEPHQAPQRGAQRGRHRGGVRQRAWTRRTARSPWATSGLRITLGQAGAGVSVGTVCDAKIVGMTQFGALPASSPALTA